MLVGTAALAAAVPPASAHPGRTNASGCHTCRTNCPKWGLKDGEYHCHGSRRPSASPRASSPVLSLPDDQPPSGDAADLPDKIPDDVRERKIMDSRDQTSGDPSKRSVPDRFQSFNLTIERIGETYRARVTDSPAGERPPVAIDPASLDPGDASPGGGRAKPTRDVHRRRDGRDDLRRLGERLFRAVFVDAVAEAFRASVERARHQGHGLRIRLQLDAAPELVTLPWEALWDPTERTFLADQPDLPVVRALTVPAAAPSPAPMKPPLRLLALLPEPRGESKLSGAAEWQRIREQLAPLVDDSVLEADHLEPPTLEALGSRLDAGPCHILHVVAHGGPGDPGSGGLLKLEDGSGGSDRVTGVDLARAMERRTAPRLVVLNACHGARAKIDDAFDGLAQHLLSRGVPAVVAMRTAISDAAAVAFAAALYRELARGWTVEAAMVEARRMLSVGEHRTEWATPALYLRGENVRLFDAAAAGVSGPAGSGRTLGRPLRRIAVPAAAVVAAGVLGALIWTKGNGPPAIADADPCPPPPGLRDLRFVEVGPGVVDLGDRRVTVEKAFCVSTQEISRRDWLEVMGDEPPRPDWPLDWPMTDVTPGAADSFLKKLEARDPGVRYALPTAAQWEYAARADQTTAYYFGDDPSELHRFGNCDNFLGHDGHDGPAPVGSFEPNPWGLHDVHGNVAEWVRWPEGAGPPWNDKGQRQALRLGGSFDSAPSRCTFSGSRSEVIAENEHRLDTGFRIVRSEDQRE